MNHVKLFIRHLGITSGLNGFLRILPQDTVECGFKQKTLILSENLSYVKETIFMKKVKTLCGQLTGNRIIDGFWICGGHDAKN